MENNRKELARTLERVAPAGWHEQAAEVMEIYDRYREAADMMERINRALGRVERPIQGELRSTKDFVLDKRYVPPPTNRI